MGVAIQFESLLKLSAIYLMKQELQAAGRPITSYTYPGTNHWFFEENRPENDAETARVAWERTIEPLHQRLD